MKYLLTIIVSITITVTYSQNINWESSSDSQKLIYLNFGYDFGLTTQLGYAHKLKTNRPIFLSADFSFPKGKELMDDFKVRLGGQISLYKIRNFTFSAKAYGVFRRHETKLVRMVNFGSETAIMLGYYKPSWHISTELGFDKSILTHLKHSNIIQDNYPAITDGWYLPSGGNFYYGFQFGKTIGKHLDLSLRLGATKAQFDNENALLPAYFGLGLSYKLNTNISK